MAELLYMDLGRAAYEPTLHLQRQLWQEVASCSDRERAYLVLVEHDPPVITLGRSAVAEHVLASPLQLAAERIEVHQIERGGDVTYHGPGELVGYPIIRLDLHGRSVRRFLRDLEEVLIRVLRRLGIEGKRIDGLTGVWVGQEKVAAIGVTIRRWVSYHGFALNVSPHLEHFDLIVPCGLGEKRVTSIERIIGRHVSCDEVQPLLLECMVDVFGFDSARQVRPERLALKA